MAQPPQTLTEHLKVERRSFLIGSIAILLVIGFVEAGLTLLYNPGWSHHPPSVTQEMAAMQQAQTQHPWAFMLLLVSTAMGLLFLNLRLSRILGRPRGAFVQPQPGQKPMGVYARNGRGFAWQAVLILNAVCLSMNIGLPEIILIIVLTRWANQAIRASQQNPAAGPAWPQSTPNS